MDRWEIRFPRAFCRTPHDGSQDLLELLGSYDDSLVSYFDRRGGGKGREEGDFFLVLSLALSRFVTGGDNSTVKTRFSSAQHLGLGTTRLGRIHLGAATGQRLTNTGWCRRLAPLIQFRPGLGNPEQQSSRGHELGSADKLCPGCWVAPPGVWIGATRAKAAKGELPREGPQDDQRAPPRVRHRHGPSLGSMVMTLCA